jgi:ACS family sodium-dependent inorganic phosphate cotransporter
MHGDSTPGHSAHRWTLVLMCALATFVSYIDRVAISVAVIPMAETHGWSGAMRGIVLSAFFVGYATAMIPSGWLVARFGGCRVMGGALLVWALLTLATPLAGALSFTTLIVTRVALGAAEAASFPAAYDLFGRNLPPQERTRAATTNLAGIPIGTVFALSTAGWLIGRFRWPSVFLVYGTLGLVATYAWFRIVPRLTSAVSSRTAGRVDRGTSIPWIRLLRHRAVWALIINHFCVNWTLYMMLTWLPSYFKDTQHLSVTGSGVYSIAPWLCQFVTSMTAATIADRRIAAGADIARVRSGMQCVGLFGSAICLVAASIAWSPLVALMCMCGALGLSGLTWAGFATNHLDIAPRHAGVLWGLTNTAGALPGIFGVAVTGALVDHTGGFTAPFILAGAISAFGGLAWLAWSSGEEVVA